MEEDDSEQLETHSKHAEASDSYEEAIVEVDGRSTFVLCGWNEWGIETEFEHMNEREKKYPEEKVVGLDFEGDLSGFL